MCVAEMMRLVSFADPDVLPISDITLLVSSQKWGLEAVAKLGGLGVKVSHTFASNQREAQRRKRYFYMGTATPKVTTLHSFKGWEPRALVVHVAHASRSISKALIYAALTRLKRHERGSLLTVVCSAEELREYGSAWPEFESLSAAATQ